MRTRRLTDAEARDMEQRLLNPPTVHQIEPLEPTCAAPYQPSEGEIAEGTRRLRADWGDADYARRMQGHVPGEMDTAVVKVSDMGVTESRTW